MSYLVCQSSAARIPLPDRSVDLVFGSPPYVDARLYLEEGKNLGIALGCSEWVEWMLEITVESLRVSRGVVMWVVAGKTEDRCYWPSCEGLLWEWWKRGLGDSFRPCYWHRHGVSGSGSSDWFRSDVEYVLCFKRPGAIPFSDNTAMGHPPKWAPGGEMSHRLSDGTRVNQWGRPSSTGSGRNKDGKAKKGGRPSHRIHTKRQANGSMQEQGYNPPVLANPGNLIRTNTGGGQLGSPYAHQNEAPFPEELAEFFVRSLCPPGGITLDPFSGSGTTTSVAVQNGRLGIGMDLRMSQCRLANRRIERPHAPVIRVARDEPEAPLFAGLRATEEA